MEEEHQVEQEQQPSKWTVVDRLVAIFVIVMVLAIVIIAICSYTGAFGWNWEWTGLTKPKQRTFWNWLSLLIVPILVLGRSSRAMRKWCKTTAVAPTASAVNSIEGAGRHQL